MEGEAYPLEEVAFLKVVVVYFQEVVEAFLSFLFFAPLMPLLLLGPER